VSPEVIANLMQTYSQSDHRIHCRPAYPASKLVKASDFLFIDPPGVKSAKNPAYPSWKSLQSYLEGREEGRPVLRWLPVKAATTRVFDGKRVKLSPPEEDLASLTARKEAEALGCRTMRTRWASGGHTVGCLLISKASGTMWAAAEAAVRHVVYSAGWQSQLSGGLLAIS
jgi:hypothetical protein